MARLIMAYTISPAATNARHPVTQILPTMVIETSSRNSFGCLFSLFWVQDELVEIGQ